MSIFRNRDSNLFLGFLFNLSLKNFLCFLNKEIYDFEMGIPDPNFLISNYARFGVGNDSGKSRPRKLDLDPADH